MRKRLTHLNEDGHIQMVDISQKDITIREAIAEGTIFMQPTTLEAIEQHTIKKGHVLAAAKMAGIMAAKNTASLIPLCHTIPLTQVELDFHLSHETNSIKIQAKVKTIGQTGAEMEALTSVCISALTIYDMCKAIDRSMTISGIVLKKKSGGKSGLFIRAEDNSSNE